MGYSFMQAAQRWTSVESYGHLRFQGYYMNCLLFRLLCDLLYGALNPFIVLVGKISTAIECVEMMSSSPISSSLLSPLVKLPDRNHRLLRYSRQPLRLQL